MLLIQKIKFKNILSSGNQFTEIDFNTNKTTLIKGNSGQGKSLIITALIFGLYGKSNRATTKKQLVNSINKKDCIVEVYFFSDGKNYKVRRGISPNIFEIYIDNVLQEELSAVKEQQKYLEQNILKMSYKTFMQVVVLGSNNYIPFMQLSSSERRDLVEEILDIKIFSTMNSLIRDKIKSIERKLRELEISKISIVEKLEMQKGFIKKIKDNGLQLISDIKIKINNILLQKTEVNTKIESLISMLDIKQNELSEINFSTKKLKQLLTIDGKLSQKKTLLNEEVEFFNNNSICPTCKQDLQVEFKGNKINEISSELFEIEKGHSDLIEAINEEEKMEEKFNDIRNSINDITFNLNSSRNDLSKLNKNQNELENEIIDIQNKIQNQNNEENILKKLIKEEKKINADYISCNKALTYFEFSHLLLKDGGIKSKIIKKYIPIINHEINKYLHMMDMYINFSLDEEFKETINTPIHEGFTYTSFSEGEKQRINLAAILSWREVSRLKNSANCNLIFFDETLDSSLDTSGIDDFLKIINYVIQDSNIFVISHREGFDDRFNKVLEVKKINGFSKILT